jgi:Domain of unknown function (DUF4124)
MTSKAITGLFAAALVCAAASVPAQTVYRHVSLAGGVIYTDQAEPPQESVETAPEAEKTPARRPYISARLAATVNASEAERRLAQAQQKRRLGVEPLPGERPLNIRYWRRQEKLRLQVEQAQHRLNATRGPQLAAQKISGLRLAASRPEEIPQDQAEHRQ